MFGAACASATKAQRHVVGKHTGIYDTSLIRRIETRRDILLEALALSTVVCDRSTTLSADAICQSVRDSLSELLTVDGLGTQAERSTEGAGLTVAGEYAGTILELSQHTLTDGGDKLTLRLSSRQNAGYGYIVEHLWSQSENTTRVTVGYWRPSNEDESGSTPSPVVFSTTYGPDLPQPASTEIAG